MWQEFDASFLTQIQFVVIYDLCLIFQGQLEFASANLDHQYQSDLVLKSLCKYVHFKTHSAPQIMQQNLAGILWQLYYIKISFAVLIPVCHFLQPLFLSFFLSLLAIISPSHLNPFLHTPSLSLTFSYFTHPLSPYDGSQVVSHPSHTSLSNSEVKSFRRTFPFRIRLRLPSPCRCIIQPARHSCTEDQYCKHFLASAFCSNE